MRIRIFLGRLQPPTRTHCQIIREMAKDPNTIPVVVMTEQARNQKSPLDVETRKRILRAVFPVHTGVRIMVVRNPYIAVKRLLAHPGIEVVAHHCGPDRSSDFRHWYKNQEVEVVEHRFPNGVRASMARDAARRLDNRKFRECCPEPAWPAMQIIAAAYHTPEVTRPEPGIDVVTPQTEQSNHQGIEALFRRRRRF
ncbi:hypothetical protein [Azospirillum sp. sgz301742]